MHNLVFCKIIIFNFGNKDAMIIDIVVYENKMAKPIKKALDVEIILIF